MELLARYTQQYAEDAFAEIVRRHLGLVYSAALRQVRSPQLAEEVAQSVFIDLARSAPKLKPDTILTAWLYQVTRRTAIDVVRCEASRQSREQIATEMNAMNATAADWTHIEPLLDEAMQALDDTDRAAVLLRYFENKSLREVGATLGTSENAAQKRLGRAVERLREFFSKRGVTVGASGLMVLISANAVPTAPAGLSAAIVAAVARLAAVPTVLATLLALLASAKLKTALITGLTALVAVMIGLRIHNQAKERESRLVSNAEPEVAQAGEQARTARPPFGRQGLPAGAAIATVEASQSSAALDWYRRGQAHEREKKYDDALADYTRAIELVEQGLPAESWFYDLYFTRASLLYGNQNEAKRNYTQALADYTHALQIKPDDYAARGNRGLAYATLRQYDQAIADYTKVIEDPDTDFSHAGGGRTNGIAWAYEYRGRANQDAKNYANAVADYTDALRLGRESGDEITIHWRIGLCYKSSQQLDKATGEANWLAERALHWATAVGGTDSERSHALTAARFASEIFDHKQPYQLEVLAAANAKAGQFGEAVMDQERALKALTPAMETQRPAMQARLELYKAGKPLSAE